VIAGGLGEEAASKLTGFLERGNIFVISFGRGHWHTAFEAWQRFGKGRHPAALGFADCLAYATASIAGEPPLAKGDGFAQADIEVA
jgi:ribonuclease VapC